MNSTLNETNINLTENCNDLVMVDELMIIVFDCTPDPRSMVWVTYPRVD